MNIGNIRTAKVWVFVGPTKSFGRFLIGALSNRSETKFAFFAFAYTNCLFLAERQCVVGV